MECSTISIISLVQLGHTSIASCLVSSLVEAKKKKNKNQLNQNNQTQEKRNQTRKTHNRWMWTWQHNNPQIQNKNLAMEEGSGRKKVINMQERVK